jgi:hypothetical protein
VANSAFLFIQPRLHARQTRLLDETTWERLNTLPGYCVFLQQTRATGLAPWLTTIGPHDEAHHIERHLSRQGDAYIREVARWLPPEWRPACQWMRAWLLPPPGTETAPFPFVSTETKERSAHANPFIRSDSPPEDDALANQWTQLHPGPDPHTHFAPLWTQQWRTLWPACPVDWRHNLEQIIDLFEQPAHAPHGTATPSRSPAAWRRIRTTLRRRFRQQIQQPAALMIHLAQAGMTLMALRGALTRRKIFQPA